METRSILVNEKATITIKTYADLDLIGWDQPEISIQYKQAGTLKVQQEGDFIEISGLDNLVVSLPVVSKVIISKVGGDAQISGVNAPLEISLRYSQ